MGKPHAPKRLCLVLAAVVALLSGCSRGPSSQLPPAGVIPAPPATTVPAPPPPPPPEVKLSDPERDSILFTAWRAKHPQEVDTFAAYLVGENLADVVPLYQLLRSASMWKECRAEPFEIPPASQWEQVRDVLILLRELQQRGVLSEVEVVSAYRDPRLNRCAGGAPGSSHQRFAIDLAPLSAQAGKQLCAYWREQGKDWDMGVSRYPSGRIHIDRAGYRTWGATHRRGSSYCLA
ncbi:MAG TPA: D-Ala-D-Ala carboxypeptidase family metallohydrolase [Ramlibacter sp.]|uniref:D-Ala-D-Ala carboxypeptidase family metallohydrolase n=1 Tax=Ramlibacter sp. TaxID=1917967 RepID=UPI002D7F9E62|nr:D-Ala-D-Ala carboxypeptidase family metallohydrolase [Ramlibacter sp.]HET8747412.1 D-Ala-D-Ala carboxypeptidase family metallohydrolase [Ramlibacter sp.]